MDFTLLLISVCSYECKLCLTLHNNEGNYLAYTQGKRHQTNLAKRAAREAKEAPIQPQPNKRKVAPRKTGKYSFRLCVSELHFPNMAFGLRFVDNLDHVFFLNSQNWEARL